MESNDDQMDGSCPKNWCELVPISGNDSVRNCEDCQRQVHRVTSMEEALQKTSEGECIALVTSNTEISEWTGLELPWDPVFGRRTFINTPRLKTFQLQFMVDRDPATRKMQIAEIAKALLLEVTFKVEFDEGSHDRLPEARATGYEERQHFDTLRYILGEFGIHVRIDHP